VTTTTAIRSDAAALTDDAIVANIDMKCWQVSYCAIVASFHQANACFCSALASLCVRRVLFLCRSRHITAIDFCLLASSSCCCHNLIFRKSTVCVAAAKHQDDVITRCQRDGEVVRRHHWCGRIFGGELDVLQHLSMCFLFF